MHNQSSLTLLIWTCGDFAAVKKRLDILGLQATPELLIKELKSEVAVKYGAQSGTIGFL